MRILILSLLAGPVLAAPAAEAAYISAYLKSTGAQVPATLKNIKSGNADDNTWVTPNQVIALGTSPQRQVFADPATPFEYTFRVTNTREADTTYRLNWAFGITTPGGLEGLRVDLLPIDVEVPGLAFEPPVPYPGAASSPSQAPAISWFERFWEKEALGVLPNPSRIDFPGTLPPLSPFFPYGLHFGLSVPYLDDPAVETYDFTLRFSPVTPEPVSAVALGLAVGVLFSRRR